jgi:signal transduction histidine kinase
MTRNSLVGRLILLAAGWSIALLIATGFGLITLFNQSALNEFDTGLREDIDTLLSGTVATSDTVFAPAITDARASRTYSGKYWELATLQDGKVVVKQDQRSRSLWDFELALPHDLPERLAKAPRHWLFYETAGPDDGSGRQRLRVAVQSATLLPYKPLTIFIVAQDRRHIDDDVRRFALITAAALFVLGMGLIVAVVIQVRVGLAPLFDLGAEILQVRVGKRSRLSSSYPAEIEPLAHQVNALLDHNQEVVERQRTHVGNLAHALKTPISVMLAEARGAPGPLAAVVERQAGLMQGQVEHHLRRARAAARSTSSGERTSVAEVLDELTHALQRVFPDGQLDWDADEALCFLGERQDLQEMAGNLIENACKYRKRRVDIHAEPIGPARLRLTVEDDGPGLPEEARAAALKRGQRLDESLPGSGLGLAIVAELAAAYGGALALGQSRLGGLKVELDLPRAG